MNEIKARDTVYLEEYGVTVRPYLTYAEIQNIANSIHAMDMWAVREQTRDMLILATVTDIDTKTLEEIGHDTLYGSGLIDEVMCTVKNTYLIDMALEYTESTSRALFQILKELPKITKPLEDVMKKYGKYQK